MGQEQLEAVFFPFWLFEPSRCPDKPSSSPCGLVCLTSSHGGCADPDGSKTRLKPTRWHTFDANKLNELHFLWPSTPLISDPLLSRTLGGTGSRVTCLFASYAWQTLTSIKKKKTLFSLVLKSIKYECKIFLFLKIKRWITPVWVDLSKQCAEEYYLYGEGFSLKYVHVEIQWLLSMHFQIYCWHRCQIIILRTI